MKYCYNCGKEVSDNAAVCLNCGCNPHFVVRNNRQTIFCNNCGKEINSQAVICINCGCQVEAENQNLNTGVSPFKKKINREELLDTLSKRNRTDSIIWLSIAVIQLIAGVYIGAYMKLYFVAIVGVVNLIYGIKEYNYSANIKKRPVGIVEKFEPLTSTIFILVYNLFIGGMVGVIAIIYYLMAVRQYVMDNKDSFLQIENEYLKNHPEEIETNKENHADRQEGTKKQDSRKGNEVADKNISVPPDNKEKSDIDKLIELKELLDNGLISADEFKMQKDIVLGPLPEKETVKNEHVE